MSDKSGLKTRSLGLKTLVQHDSLQPCHSMSLSAVCPGKTVMGPRFKVSSERLEKPLIEPMTLGLQGEYLLNYHYTMEASFLSIIC